jgi:hypothetical protein
MTKGYEPESIYKSREYFIYINEILFDAGL